MTKRESSENRSRNRGNFNPAVPAENNTKANAKGKIYLSIKKGKNMRALSIKATSIAATILSIFLFADFAFANCTWTVSGTVKVATQDADLSSKFGTQIPLDGIQVKISGATIGTFASWGTVNTDSLGKFTMTKTKTCEDRKLKIEVKFENDDIKIIKDPGLLPTTGPEWYTIIEDSDRRRVAGAIQIVPTVFDAGKNHDLDDPDARDHADLWVMADTLRDHLATYGTNFKFTKKTVIEYPNNDQFIGDGLESSFANPLTQDINIFRSNDGTEDHLNVNSVFHEMMHVWAYQHVSGELDMATNLLITGDTHCVNTKEHISFHEGFAEFAMEKLGNEIFSSSFASKTLPFNRDALNEGLSCGGGVDQIDTLLDMEQHEYGWMSLFRTLTTNELWRYTYAGEATSTSTTSSSVFISKPFFVPVTGACSNPTNKTLKNVLDVFLPHSTKGFPSNLTKTEMNFDDFLARSAAILDFEEDEIGIKRLLDPALTSEPQTELCGK